MQFVSDSATDRSLNGMNIHVWEENGEWFWDDADDHGGFDRNVPCGPFPAKHAAIADANTISPNAPVRLVINYKPPRYENDP